MFRIEKPEKSDKQEEKESLIIFPLEVIFIVFPSSLSLFSKTGSNYILFGGLL